MLLALKIKAAIVAAAVAASPVAVFVATPSQESVRRAALAAPDMVEVPPGSFRYWEAGAFTRDGKPAAAPPRTVALRRPIAAMRYQVSEAEYGRCVAERACPPRAGAADRSDLPAVMVSGRDADTYAAWLSRRLGQRYRLPTDEEWTYFAGRRAPDEAPPARDARDPAKAWIARYEREARLDPADMELRPAGGFGANEHGLFDIAGNVWEWTASCYSRVALDGTRARTENCGVRVVEGRHRAYVTDFVRDARGGGCAAGTPPRYLGFRLVRDEEPTGWLSTWMAKLTKN